MSKRLSRTEEEASARRGSRSTGKTDIAARLDADAADGSRRVTSVAADVSSFRESWPLRLTALALLLLGVVPMANLVTAGNGLPWWHSAVEQWVLWGTMTLCIAIAIAFAFPRRTLAFHERTTSLLLSPSPRAFGVIIGVSATTLALCFGWWMFRLVPVAGDEFAQRWQAELLAHGRLFAHPESAGEFFSTSETLVVGDRWFSQFPVGGPLALAIGVLLRAAWIVSPLCCGVATAAVYRFFARTSDELTARTTALLVALSTFVTFLGGTEMNHAVTLALLWVALAALPRWLAAEDNAAARGPAMLIGACVGYCATVRPFDAAVFAACIGAFQLRHAIAERWRWRSLLLLGLVGIVPVILLLLANRATVGSAFTFAYDALNGPEHRPGFHVTPLGFEHTPRRGLYMISAYLMKLDVGLTSWPVPQILVVAIALAFMRRVTTWDRLLVALLALLTFGYFTYWSESYFAGPRFLYAVAPILLYFAGRAPGVIRDRLSMPNFARATVLLLPIWTIAAYVAPTGDTLLFGVRQAARGYAVRNMPGPAIVNAVHSAGVTRALVFVNDGWHGRLAARLRDLGMRPLLAEQAAAQFDACFLTRTLDAADRLPATVPADVRLRSVITAVVNDTGAKRVSGLPPSDQVSFVPGRPLPADCLFDVNSVSSNGASMLEMLRFEPIDRDGRINGDVVYARDFGVRNERLRSRFGDRPWFVAKVERDTATVRATLVPYTPPSVR